MTDEVSRGSNWMSTARECDQIPSPRSRGNTVQANHFDWCRHSFKHKRNFDILGARGKAGKD